MLSLAPGVLFDADKHEYWYKGKQLSGVTGLISKKLGLKYSSSFVDEHREEGLHIHKAIQRWIETGYADSVHPGVKWVIEKLVFHDQFYSEVLVTDFKEYASSVDLVYDFAGQTMGNVHIYDIKKGKFSREYVTWQLSIYKYFIEKTTKYKVTKCYCLAIKDKEVYPIFPKSEEVISQMLYGYYATGSVTV